MQLTMFRAGDHVKHLPTGENWILAVDQFGYEVSPCGWPETIAKANDLVLTKRASDHERIKQLKSSSQIQDSHDVRAREAKHQLTGELCD